MVNALACRAGGSGLIPTVSKSNTAQLFIRFFLLLGINGAKHDNMHDIGSPLSGRTHTNTSNAI